MWTLARWSTPIELHELEQKSLKCMIDDVLKFPKVKYVLSLRPNIVAFSDASDEAGGVVIYDEGRIVTVCIPWNHHERSLGIIAKEALAAWLAVFLSTQGANRHRIPILAVDNTNVFFGIINGMSSVKCANSAIGLIRNRCQVCLMWLPTESMPADVISRLQLPESSLVFSRFIHSLLAGGWGNYFVVPQYSS